MALLQRIHPEIGLLSLVFRELAWRFGIYLMKI